MKATKFVLTVALISFAVLAFSRPEPRTLSVKIKLSTALENRTLVKAMYQQLDVSLLHNDVPGYITARVSYRHVVYYIYGKYEEWKNFFVMDMKDDPVGITPGKRLASRVK
jgi:hypothetical protein